MNLRIIREARVFYLHLIVWQLSLFCLYAQTSVRALPQVDPHLIEKIQANFDWYIDWQTEKLMKPQIPLPISTQCSVFLFEKGARLTCSPPRLVITIVEVASGGCVIRDIRNDIGVMDYSLGNPLDEDRAQVCGFSKASYLRLDSKQSSSSIDVAATRNFKLFVQKDLDHWSKREFDDLLIPIVKSNVRFFDVYALLNGKLAWVQQYEMATDDGICCTRGIKLDGSLKRKFPPGALDRVKSRKLWFID